MKNIPVLRNSLFLMVMCSFLFMTPVQAAGTVSAVGGVPEGAQIFWKEFRAAVLDILSDKGKLNKDATVIAMTKFPFKTRGDLDSDPERSYDKEAFLKLFKTIFNQYDRRAQKIISEVMKERPSLIAKNVHGSKMFRIENLVFKEQDDGKWLFTFAYVLEDDVKSLFGK
ncbi:hypothetical protein QUF74_01015 [Candidatus Halobeggiatoa sp. HSG11]|nr:hypothetical protein [Candidatus Halobeggiatoa sp. HSG11]